MLFQRPELSDCLSPQVPRSTTLSSPDFGMRNRDAGVACTSARVILNLVKIGNYFKDCLGIEHSQRGKHISLLGLKMMSSDN